MRRPTLLLLLFLPACLAKQLRTPAEDHYVQARHIAESCAAGNYGDCAPELREDLEAMQKQACLIHAISKGTDGGECTDPREAARAAHALELAWARAFDGQRPDDADLQAYADAVGILECVGAGQ